MGGRGLERTAELVVRRPEAAFALLIAIHVAVWTALPILCWKNPPLDVIEGLTFGPLWRLESWKHPPLPWWIAAAVTSIVRGAPAVYLVSQLAVALCFWAVWRLGVEIVGPLRALAGVAALEGIHYYTFTSPKWNHDVASLPCWSLACLAFWRALASGRARDWALAGAALGLLWWAKYVAVVLAFTLAGFLALDREARAHLGTRGPWIAAAVALCVAAPNLAAVAARGLGPWRFLDYRMEVAGGFLDHLRFPLEFLAGQALALGPALLLLALASSGRSSSATGSEERSALGLRYLTFLTFGPIAICLAGSLLLGRKLVPLWGYPLWSFLGIYTVAALGRDLGLAGVRRAILGTLAVLVISAAAFVLDYSFLVRLDGRYRATNFPGVEVSRIVTTEWREATGRPLRYVVASFWLGGNISWHSEERPEVFVDADPERAPWIDTADLRRQGAVIAWTLPDVAPPPAFARYLAEAERKPPIVVPGAAPSRPPHVIEWAILRPRE
jgi:4-amino-4-deoxy-L-arabinose transferase-like glycosyltransferase